MGRTKQKRNEREREGKRESNGVEERKQNNRRTSCIPVEKFPGRQRDPASERRESFSRCFSRGCSVGGCETGAEEGGFRRTAWLPVRGAGGGLTVSGEAHFIGGRDGAVSSLPSPPFLCRPFHPILPRLRQPPYFLSVHIFTCPSAPPLSPRATGLFFSPFVFPALSHRHPSILLLLLLHPTAAVRNDRRREGGGWHGGGTRNAWLATLLDAPDESVRPGVDDDAVWATLRSPATPTRG